MKGWIIGPLIALITVLAIAIIGATLLGIWGNLMTEPVPIASVSTPTPEVRVIDTVLNKYSTALRELFGEITDYRCESEQNKHLELIMCVVDVRYRSFDVMHLYTIYNLQAKEIEQFMLLGYVSKSYDPQYGEAIVCVNTNGSQDCETFDVAGDQYRNIVDEARELHYKLIGR